MTDPSGPFTRISLSGFMPTSSFLSLVCNHHCAARIAGDVVLPPRYDVSTYLGPVVRDPGGLPVVEDQVVVVDAVSTSRLALAMTWRRRGRRLAAHQLRPHSTPPNLARVSLACWTRLSRYVVSMSPSFASSLTMLASSQIYPCLPVAA